MNLVHTLLKVTVIGGKTMNYKDLNEETKEYLKKAMDIYFTIKDNIIIKKVKITVLKENYRFCKADKKVLSLFIAGFLTSGNLKNILDEYDNIKLNDLLEFTNLKLEDIGKLSENDYANFYHENLESDIKNFICSYKNIKRINYISPEFILFSLKYANFNGIKILDYFSGNHNLGMFFSENALFSRLEEYIKASGSIKEEKIFETFLKTSRTNTDKILRVKRKYIDFNSENVWPLLDEIKQKFVGQEQTVEQLFYNIINNQQLVHASDVLGNQRSIIFLDGSTGTGKTAITREITKKIEVPLVSTSIANYSAAGYVGGNLTDILVELYEKSGEDLKRAESGVVILDEFDKIAYSQSDGLIMKQSIQHDLLDFLGGGKYTINVENKMFESNMVEFDTSKLTFICLAALTDLREQKTEIKQPIGFGSENCKTNQNYSINPSDLIKIGLERELVGRLNTYIHTQDYTKEDLSEILRKSTISPLIGFKTWVEFKNKNLKIDDSIYDIIAQQAYELKTGARGLQTVMNNIRTYFLKEVLRGTDKTIYLNSETIIEIYDQTFNRKPRI